MKILIRNSDNVVMYADDSLTLSADSLRGKEWIDYQFNTSNATIEDATLPANWTGLAYSFSNGAFAVVDQAILDERLAKKNFVPVPQSVPKVAAELALIDADMDTLPATYFASLTGKAKKRAQALWDKNPVVKLSSPVLLAAIASGVVTQAQVDALMIAADVIAMTEL